MKKRLLKEYYCSDNTDGTDFPYYEFENGDSVGGCWQDADAFPFGYWEDCSGDYMFCVGKESQTHRTAAFFSMIDVAEGTLDDFSQEYAEYIEDILDEAINDIEGKTDDVNQQHEEVNSIVSKVCDMINSRPWIFDDFANEERVKQWLDEIVEDNVPASYLDINQQAYKWYYENWIDPIKKSGNQGEIGKDDGGEKDVDNLLDDLSLDYQDIFGRGDMIGRVFFDSELISFYNEIDVTPDKIMKLTKDLGEKFDMDSNEFADFYIIYTGYNDEGSEYAECNTIRNFVEGVSLEDANNAQLSASNSMPVIHNMDAAQKRDTDQIKNYLNTKNKKYGEIEASLRKAGKSDTLAYYHSLLNQESKTPKTITLSEKQFNLLVKKMLNEEVVADGNSEHNPYAKKWKHQKDSLRDFIVNNGILMQSMENGKVYKVVYATDLSNLIGIEFVYCVQYDQQKMEPVGTSYLRALDTFRYDIKKVEFDTRGRDNKSGTADDTTAKK